MISSFFATLLGGIKTTLALGIIGAAVGVGSLLIGRLISGLTGYIAAAALGAVILVMAYGSASFDSYRVRQKEAEITQLKYDRAKIAQSRDALLAAGKKQDEIVAAQAQQIESDRAQMETLDRLAKEHAAQIEAEAPAVCERDMKARGIVRKQKPAPIIYPDELKEIFRR